MVRGVNKILKRSFQQYSTDTINDMRISSINNERLYTFVEGEWTKPIKTDYACFPSERTYFY